MGKRAVAASRIAKGGRGTSKSTRQRRRVESDTTATGRARSAHRWSTEAAVFASKQQHWLFKFGSAQSLCAVMMRALKPGDGLDAFMSGTIIRTAPRHVQELIRSILQDHKDKVADKPAKLKYQATQVTERLRAHAGPPGLVTEVEQPDPQVVVRSPGWWLDKPGKPPQKEPRPDPPPAPGGRMLRRLKAWGLERLGPLPDHAVITFERAEGRVISWRNDNKKADDAPPPLRLLQALIFTKTYPTLVASEADHYWLVALERWASASEVMRLFGIPEGSAAWKALISSPLTARQLVAALGRAVHVGAATQAFMMADAAANASPHRVPRYASACSGIDLMAVAFGRAIGGPYVHTGASEIDESVVDTLVHMHAHVGLKDTDVINDARDAAAVAAAQPADVWAITPPCEPFSRRNHYRSVEDILEAARELGEMLVYARIHKPASIVVENVNEPEARSAIEAALLSLPGYTWVTFASEARVFDGMSRERRFWVGNRR